MLKQILVGLSDDVTDPLERASCGWPCKYDVFVDGQWPVGRGPLERDAGLCGLGSDDWSWITNFKRDRVEQLGRVIRKQPGSIRARGNRSSEHNNAVCFDSASGG